MPFASRGNIWFIFRSYGFFIKCEWLFFRIHSQRLVKNFFFLIKAVVMRKELHNKCLNSIRAVRNWVIPYINSRIHKGKLRPLVGYLVTDWKCNINCDYCFQYKNDFSGMTIETALSGIDWLQSLGCGVIGITGGEPLVRKDFVLELVRYGSKKGFFMDLATNGFFMDEKFIDDLGAAGIASVNLAVDCVKARRGMPKALLSIEPQFRYLVKQKKKYHYLVVLNINICSTNIKEIKFLTEIARQNRVGADYHLNEVPQELINIDHYKNLENKLWITSEQYSEVEDLADWLIEKRRRGWAIVNPSQYFKDIKCRIRGEVPRWDCRAGINSVVIRPDGSLAPCYNLMNSTHDWGCIWEPKFDMGVLREVKDECNPKCTSICLYMVSNYCKLQDLPEWILQHIKLG